VTGWYIALGVSLAFCATSILLWRFGR